MPPASWPRCAALAEIRGCAAVVTGAGGGLGRGIAADLAARGARVVALDVDIAGAEETARRIKLAGGAAWSSGADITDEAETAAAIGWAHDRLGALDLLVNSAGVLSCAPVVELEPAEWRRILEVNATGVFLTSQAAARLMIRDGRSGSIVSVASIAGKVGEAGLAHYAASKFAVIGFTQALARELATNDITVNAVCPGVVVTPMIKQLATGWETSVEAMVGEQAIPRPQTPEEIAAAVVFLHTNRSVTGQALNIDGGTVFW